jgi:hypothetical protein
VGKVGKTSNLIAIDEVLVAHQPDDIRTIYGYTVDLSELGSTGRS